MLFRSTGTPIVSVEGAFLCSRFVAGGYRQMGLADAPVADNHTAMADLAIALLQDPVRRETMRQHIAATARDRLFDGMDMVRSFEAFACDAIEHAHSQSPPP